MATRLIAELKFNFVALTRLRLPRSPLAAMLRIAAHLRSLAMTGVGTCASRGMGCCHAPHRLDRCKLPQPLFCPYSPRREFRFIATAALPPLTRQDRSSTSSQPPLVHRLPAETGVVVYRDRHSPPFTSQDKSKKTFHPRYHRSNPAVSVYRPSVTQPLEQSAICNRKTSA